MLELRRAVPLHLRFGAVLAEAERVKDAARLDVVSHEPVEDVCGGWCRGRRLFPRHLEAFWFRFAAVDFTRRCAVRRREDQEESTRGAQEMQDG